MAGGMQEESLFLVQLAMKQASSITLQHSNILFFALKQDESKPSPAHSREDSSVHCLNCAPNFSRVTTRTVSAGNELGLWDHVTRFQSSSPFFYL